MNILEQLLNNSGRKKRTFRLKSRYPKRLERRYRARLNRIIVRLNTQIRSELLPLIRRRDDTLEDDIQRVLDRLTQSINLMNINADDIANAIENEKIDELARVIGVDLFSQTAAFDFTEILKVWIASNTSLITKMSTDYIASVAGIVNRGFVQGLAYTELIDDIRKATKISFNRAALIARNEVGNLNAQITIKRNEDLGVKEYIWRTSRDERVRGNPSGLYPKAIPSHYDRNGKKYTYSKGAGSKDRHPGLGIQCRCTAESIIIFDN